MRKVLWAVFVLALTGLWALTSGCDDGSALESNGGILARVEALETEVTSLKEKNTALETALASKANTADIGDHLTADGVADHVTTSELATALADYTRTEDLPTGGGGGVTPTELADAIADFVTTSELTAANADFITASELDDATSAFVTQSDADTALAAYATTASLDDVVRADTDVFVRLIDDGAIVVNVPADHATLNDALRWLDGYRITSDAFVTLQVADGTYVSTERIEIRHPNGDRIEIVGNPDDPSAVVFEFTGVGGFRVRHNAAIAWSEGFTVRGDGLTSANGIEARDGGLFRAGQFYQAEPRDEPAIIVENFGNDGVRAFRGGLVSAFGVVSRNNGRSGFHAFSDGQIEASDGRAHDNGNDGYEVSFSASIRARDTTSIDNGNRGYGCFMGGLLDIRGGVASGNDADGIHGAFGCQIDAEDATADNNNENGFGIYAGSAMRANNAASTGNEVGFAVGNAASMIGDQATASMNDRSGFEAYNSASIDAFEATADQNGGHGFVASLSSSIWVVGASSTDNGGAGFEANDASALDASWGRSTDSGSWGLVSRQNSSVRAVRAAITGSQFEGVHVAGGFADVAWATINGNLGNDVSAAQVNSFWGGYALANNTTVTPAGGGPAYEPADSLVGWDGAFSHSNDNPGELAPCPWWIDDMDTGTCDWPQ